MKPDRRATDISIRSAVIAWQPTFPLRARYKAAPGDVSVFEFLDPAERAFALTHGACWFNWAEQPIGELIYTLLWLKREMIRDFGISPYRIEDAYYNIPEYRHRRLWTTLTQSSRKAP